MWLVMSGGWYDWVCGLCPFPQTEHSKVLETGPDSVLRRSSGELWSRHRHRLLVMSPTHWTSPHLLTAGWNRSTCWYVASLVEEDSCPSVLEYPTGIWILNVRSGTFLMMADWQTCSRCILGEGQSTLHCNMPVTEHFVFGVWNGALSTHLVQSVCVLRDPSTSARLMQWGLYWASTVICQDTVA
jgi:hypothetical protein